MLYEFLQRNQIDAMAVTILTDGLKPNEANLFGVVFSDIPGLIFDRAKTTFEPFPILVPGADPSQNYQFHGFSIQKYKDLTSHCSYEDQIREIELILQEHDLFINYRRSFFESFLDPALFSCSWNFLDITTEHCLTGEMVDEAEKQDSKQELINTFLSSVTERSKSAAEGSMNFKEKSKKVKAECEPLMENDPMWKKQNRILQTLITEC